MAALVCDICGGKLVMGVGGVATCESCGMQHSADRMKEKVQEIKGTVRVDNTHMINNYLEMAERAYSSSNNAETESYCNKIIEIDPNNYQALMLKGKAAGWQSSLGDNRFEEAINCFATAITNAPDDEKDEYISDAKDQIMGLTSALMSLQADRFSDWPDAKEAAGLLDVTVTTMKSLLQFIQTIGIGIIDKDELMAPLATQINNSVMNAWNHKIVPEYSNDSDGHPDDYAFKKLIERGSYCTDLLEQAINLSDGDDYADITRYENMISIHQYIMASCSYEYKTVAGYDRWDGSTIWENKYVKSLELNENAKSIRNAQISSYRSKIKDIESEVAAKKKAEAKERFEQYWSEHSEEKVAFEKELGDLQREISEYKSEIAQIPGAAEVKNISDHISQLSSEKSALGLFKMKEKKAIQEKIDAQYIELKKVQDRMSADRAKIHRKIEPLQSRINEINEELTKER